MTILMLLVLTGGKSSEMQQWQDAVLLKKRGRFSELSAVLQTAKFPVYLETCTDFVRSPW